MATSSRRKKGRSCRLGGASTDALVPPDDDQVSLGDGLKSTPGRVSEWALRDQGMPGVDHVFAGSRECLA